MSVMEGYAIAAGGQSRAYSKVSNGRGGTNWMERRMEWLAKMRVPRLWKFVSDSDDDVGEALVVRYID